MIVMKLLNNMMYVNYQVWCGIHGSLDNEG